MTQKAAEPPDRVLHRFPQLSFFQPSHRQGLHLLAGHGVQIQLAQHRLDVVNQRLLVPLVSAGFAGVLDAVEKGLGESFQCHASRVAIERRLTRCQAGLDLLSDKMSTVVMLFAWIGSFGPETSGFRCKPTVQLSCGANGRNACASTWRNWADWQSEPRVSRCSFGVAGRPKFSYRVVSV